MARRVLERADRGARTLGVRRAVDLPFGAALSGRVGTREHRSVGRGRQRGEHHERARGARPRGPPNQRRSAARAMPASMVWNTAPCKGRIAYQ
jgi:hypothetical protein